MIRPRTLEEARGAAGSYRAGGTDLHARRRLGLEGGEIVDLRDVEEMRGIEPSGDGLRIGAMTRMSTLATAGQIAEGYPGLALAAGSLATPQIRAVGTLGGNLLQRNRCPYYRHPAFSCFKSGGSSCPAREGDHRHGVVFDLGPCVSPHPSTLAAALLAYEADVETGDGSTIGVGELLGDGSDGRRDHLLAEGEVLVAVVLGAPWEGERAAYRRATGRALAEWPSVEAVCRLQVSDGQIDRARLAVGGVAPVPLRRPEVEDALAGKAVEDAAGLREAALLAGRGANPLPMTGHKLALLPNLVLDAVSSAIAGDASSEVAVGEGALPAHPGRM
ncbi:MAG: FAD binding domain-containing protein [Actinomycetota bacterium]